VYSQHDNLHREIIIRNYADRTPNPLEKGAFRIPPLKRGARGDLNFSIREIIIRNYANRTPNPLEKGAFRIPPLKRGLLEFPP
jgi:hypothetical protein